MPSKGQEENALGAPSVVALKQSCWGQMPPELLRDVLARIEEAEGSWMHLKDVVACAGVCQSWRVAMKEIVKRPEVSGRLTFPISLKQPGPRDFPLQCFIKRNRAAQTYHLYLGLTQGLVNEGKFLLAAQRCRGPTYTDYLISLNANNISRGNGPYLGKLRSNFFGTKFTISDAHPPHAGAKVSRSRSLRIVGNKQISPRVPAGNYPVAHIAYNLNVLGSKCPRRMNCVMDSIPASAIKPEGLSPAETEFSLASVDYFRSIPFFGSESSLSESSYGSSSEFKEEKLILKNKKPKWHEQLRCWCLNFNGRVTVASVKNFQLVASDEYGSSSEDNVIVQFGKVDKDLFTMDYCYPISAFQAFAICLSSFHTKIACE